jgi:hypothetical protein
MTDILVTGQEAYFNEDTKFFNDVYIYGKLYYDFIGFDEGDNVIVGILTVTKRLDVGIGGTILRVIADPDGLPFLTGKVGIGSTAPIQSLDVVGSALFTGNIGIGTTTIPQQKLDVGGSVKIDDFIYDSVNSPGVNGYYLNMDAGGVRWINASPNYSVGIFVQDEGIYIPTTGLAKSFTVLNFKQLNSLGVGTDTIIPIPNPSNPNFIADIQSQDFWGHTGDGNIYRMTNVGIQNNNPTSTLDIGGTLHTTGAVDFDSTLNVDGAATLQTTLNVKGATDLDTTLNVDGATVLQTTLNVKGATDLDTTLNVDGATVLQTTLNVKGATDLDTTLNVDGAATLQTTLNVKGATDLDTTLNVDGAATLQTTLNVKGATDLDTTLNVDGATNLNSTLQVGVAGTVITTTGIGSVGIGTNNPQFDIDLAKNVKFRKAIIDTNNSTALGKFDYRLSSVGTGVSWRPPGVQTQNAIWVTTDGNDSNSGYLEGDAKRTIGAAAAIAEAGDTIFVRSGVYYENNPIGLRTDVSVSGQDLRLVTIVPNNLGKDIFHVRRGCLVENVNFSCETGQNNPGGGAVAFPPTTTDIVAGKSYAPVSGYTAPGPATEGSSGRWRSPYIRNCTNFMPLSIGMKINGDHATATEIGADLKCMVCDSFTQYNEAGIGVSITNNGYAQLVSIFTINCDKAIYVDTGGQCDLTNSNSSFGNFGLYAVGLGKTEFTGKVKENTSPQNVDGRLNDKVGLTSVFAVGTNTPRRPYDGQALWFKINLAKYTDVNGLTGIITAPLQRLASITVINSDSIYSSSSPPSVIIQDVDGTYPPKGPQGIIAEASANIDDTTGKIVSIDIINSGRNYLPSQDIRVVIDGTVQPKNKYLANMEPIYFTVLESTDNRTSPTGITTTTFNEFIPYELFENDEIELKRISRILTSTHSFEYIGAGTSINTATPQSGGVPIKANEIVKLDGAQIPFTSTDQKGNFDIGEGIQVNQTTSTISGRDFSRAIQAEVTPLILALR